MNKKFLEIVARHSTLASLAAKGEASPEQIKEMENLGAAIKAVTAKDDSVAKTTLTTMKLKEFREWHDAAIESIEAGVADPDLLGLVKSNLAAVKSQKKTKADDLVAVEMPIAKSEGDKLAELEAKIRELEAKFEGGTGDGEEGKQTPKGSEKGDKPTAQALALEAIDTLLAKYEKIKTAISTGSLSKDDVKELYGDWQIKDAISQAAAIMAKADELKAAAAAITPALEELAKQEESGEEADDTDTEEGGEENGDGDKPTTEKGDKPSAWMMGMDIAPQAGPEEHNADVAKNRLKHGRF